MWLKQKERAIKNDDYKGYLKYLQIQRGEFTKLYGQMKKPDWRKFIGDIIQKTTCEIREINIKYKKIQGKSK